MSKDDDLDDAIELIAQAVATERARVVKILTVTQRGVDRLQQGLGSDRTQYLYASRLLSKIIDAVTNPALPNNATKKDE